MCHKSDSDGKGERLRYKLCSLTDGKIAARRLAKVDELRL